MIVVLIVIAVLLLCLVLANPLARYCLAVILSLPIRLLRMIAIPTIVVVVAGFGLLALPEEYRSPVLVSSLLTYALWKTRPRRPVVDIVETKHEDRS